MDDLQHYLKIAAELNIGLKSLEATANLLAEGATVPFIARYRKEATGELEKRREAILKSIKDQEKLTPELEAKINAAETMAVLEDIYLPYKPKRRTKATIAREKGLEPLATKLFEQASFDVDAEAEQFVSAEKEVKDKEEAL